MAKVGEEYYGLAPEFERALVLAFAMRPPMYGLLAEHMEVEALRDPAAKLGLRICRAIGKESGNGPSSILTVIQRGARWMAEGKISADELDMLRDLLSDTPEPPSNEDLINEVAPLLRKEKQRAAMKAGFDAWQSGGDFKQVQAMLTQAEGIGVADSRRGMRLGGNAISAVRAMKFGERLPTGIMELDMAMNGGVPRGWTALVQANTSGGKSMFLLQVLAHALRAGHLVGYVTMELDEEFVMARLYAHLSGVPINEILDGTREAEAVARVQALEPTFGTFIAKWLPSGSTPDDVEDWVKKEEDAEGRQMTVVAYDYIQKMRAPKRVLRSRGTERVEKVDNLGLAAECVFNTTKERRRWSWVAGQAKGVQGKEKYKRIENEGIGGAYAITQTVDVVVGISPESEAKLALNYHLSKHRSAQEGVVIGPLPHDFACAQIAPGSMY